MNPIINGTFKNLTPSVSPYQYEPKIIPDLTPITSSENVIIYVTIAQMIKLFFELLIVEDNTTPPVNSNVSGVSNFI
ncbi:MAG: hypothetical protein K6T54_08565 [Ignavibacterium sp.]|nr:hypothetical protein [Ignavibacterium sp.]